MGKKKPKPGNVTVEAMGLQIAEDRNGFVLEWRGRPIRTPAGVPVKHPSEPLLLHMRQELSEYATLTLNDGIIMKPRPLCAYLLYATQKDFVELGKHEELHPCCLASDPILHPTPGPEWAKQLNAWECVRNYLQDLGLELHPLTFYTNRPDPRHNHESREPTPVVADSNGDPGRDWNRFFATISTVRRKLDPPQKSVALNLGTLHDGNAIAGLALISGRCSPEDYANAVLATTPAHAGIFSGLTTRALHEKIFRLCRDHARACMNYLRLYDDAGPLDALIRGGENAKLEFKSTLRWNIKAGRDDEATITHAVLKTIAAFLNTEGGTLLIGIGDDGTPLGIALDHFENEDKYLLHFYNVLRQAIGATAAALVTAECHQHKGKVICRVECRRSLEPVFVRYKREEEEFFIRHGPGTTKLATSAVLAYTRSRFNPPPTDNKDRE